MVDGMIEGFALEGGYVATLQDKHFEIVAPAPAYEESRDLDNPSMTKRKLIVSIKLSNGVSTRWYANKTSQKTIMSFRGFKLSEWIGFKGEFFTAMQMINGMMKNVIYCKTAEPEVIKV